MDLTKIKTDEDSLKKTPLKKVPFLNEEEREGYYRKFLTDLIDKFKIETLDVYHDLVETIPVPYERWSSWLSTGHLTILLRCRKKEDVFFRKFEDYEIKHKMGDEIHFYNKRNKLSRDSEERREEIQAHIKKLREEHAALLRGEKVLLKEKFVKPPKTKRKSKK